MASVAEVYLWGRRVGAVSWSVDDQVGAFEYDRGFINNGFSLSPIKLPLSGGVFVFPELSGDAFHGLPGLVSDSLPDKFGHRVIDAWLASKGIPSHNFTPVDRLLYIGTRGMGALEFHPPSGPEQKSVPVDIKALVEMANHVLSERRDFHGRLPVNPDSGAIEQLLQVGVSAGGARAKALIAWNPDIEEVRSGQVPVPKGFSYWLIKFDGVENNKDREVVADPQGYGLVEYAYYKMARAAGIDMMESRMLEDGPRRHFMTRRFDRTDSGEKIHMLSLSGMAHYNWNMPGAFGYEQLMKACREVTRGDMDDLLSVFRRMTFNVIARNCDDHTKNIAWLMDKQGRWRLAPAFDMTYAYNPDGQWASGHQISINGKRKDIRREDVLAVASSASIKKSEAIRIINEVARAVRAWPHFSGEAGVRHDWAREIGTQHRVAEIAGPDWLPPAPTPC